MKMVSNSIYLFIYAVIQHVLLVRTVSVYFIRNLIHFPVWFYLFIHLLNHLFIYILLMKAFSSLYSFGVSYIYSSFLLFLIWIYIYIFLLSSIPHLDFLYTYSSFLLFYFYITWKEVEMYSSVYRPCWRARVAAFVRHPPGCLRWRHRVPVAARYVHFRQHRRRTRLFSPLWMAGTCQKRLYICTSIQDLW